MTYDAILFDMDGVLLSGYETPPEVYRKATRRLLTGFGVAPEVDGIPDGLAVPGSAATFRTACQSIGLPPAPAWAYRERVSSGIARDRLRAGKREPFNDASVLADLGAHYEIGICSNNRHDTVGDCTELFDWDTVDTFRGRFPTLGDYDERKPKPTYLEWVLERLNAAEPLFVGDRISDIQTASAIDCDAALLTRRGPVPTGTVEPTFHIEGLDELYTLHESNWHVDP